jgi:NAD(P)-dependent dehydrogenase (short-subunit alcohol dehydrogenase family)
MPLKNFKILLTGASRGIGAALAKTLAHAGAGVAILARDEAKLKEVASQIMNRGGRAIPLVADVARPEEVTAAVSEANKRLGGIDILVNAAAIQLPIGPFTENDLVAWEHALQVNLMGPVRIIHAVLPIMKGQLGGKIINFSGGGAAGPRPNFSAYSASKAALVRLTETLALELEPFNIQINAVAPGAVNTQMLDEVLVAGEKAGAEYKQALARLESGGTPVDLVCELVLFLSSPASGCLTGKLISAPHDPWREWSGRAVEINASPMYTIRRLDPFTIKPLIKDLI